MFVTVLVAFAGSVDGRELVILSSNSTLSSASSATDSQESLDFYTLTPCRLVDTRLGSMRMTSGVQWFFNAAGNGPCGIPEGAKAVSLNVTVVGPTNLGHVTLFPSDKTLPTTSTINFGSGEIRANNAIIPLGADGRLSAQATLAGGSGDLDLVIDVNGYFGNNTGQFMDDFEQASFVPYTTVKFGSGTESVSWGFVLDGASMVLEGSGGGQHGGGDSITYLTDAALSDVRVSARVKIVEMRNAGHHSGLVARFDPTEPALEYYELWVNAGSNLLILSRRVVGTPEVRLASVSIPAALLADWVELELEITGSDLRGRLNGEELIHVTDTAFTHGTVGLINAGAVTRYDDFLVEDLGNGSLP